MLHGLEAVRPEWRPLVEMARQRNSVVDLPPGPPAGLQGPGRYSLARGVIRSDGKRLHRLFWVEYFGRQVKLGAYALDASAPLGPRSKMGRRARQEINPEFGSELTVGFDALGRRIMRVNCGRNEWLVAVQIDAQGLPYPVPV